MNATLLDVFLLEKYKGTPAHDLTHIKPKDRILLQVKSPIKIKLNKNLIEHYLIHEQLVITTSIRKRLGFLLHTYSNDVKNGTVSIEDLNKIGIFCIRVVPLIEQKRIVAPTINEINWLFKWYLDVKNRAKKSKPIILTTVCPDYSYNLVHNRAVYTGASVGSAIA
jgi:hypothetical protein